MTMKMETQTAQPPSPVEEKKSSVEFTDCYLARLLNSKLPKERFHHALGRAAKRRLENPELTRSYNQTTLVLVLGVLGVCMAAAAGLIQNVGGWLMVGGAVMWSLFFAWIFWVHIGLVRASDGSLRKSFGIPNTLTFFRILMVPAIFHYLYDPFSWGPLQVWGLFIILAVGLTDTLDGTLARLLDQQSDFGRFSDPLADVATTASSAVAITLSGVVPPALAGLILFRYIGAFLGFVVTFIKGGRFDFGPTILGKICTPLVQMTFFFLFLGHVKPAWALPAPGPTLLIYATAGVVCLNTLYLFYRWYSLSRRAKKSPSSKN